MISDRQIETCVRALDTLVGCLRVYRDADAHTPDSDKWKTAHPALDGGVSTSLEVSVMNACRRLDTLFENDAGWSTTSHEGLVKLIRSTTMAQRAKMKAEREAAREQVRPSRRLPLRFTRSGLEILVTFTGDNFTITGRGLSLDAALVDFDHVATRESVVNPDEDSDFGVPMTPPKTPKTLRNRKQIPPSNNAPSK
jgi:hypothetical protein